MPRQRASLLDRFKPYLSERMSYGRLGIATRSARNPSATPVGNSSVQQARHHDKVRDTDHPAAMLGDQNDPLLIDNHGLSHPLVVLRHCGNHLALRPRRRKLRQQPHHAGKIAPRRTHTSVAITGERIDHIRSSPVTRFTLAPSGSPLHGVWIDGGRDGLGEGDEAVRAQRSSPSSLRTSRPMRRDRPLSRATPRATAMSANTATRMTTSIARA